VPGPGQSTSGQSKPDQNLPEVGSHGLVVVANRLPVDRQTNPDGSSTWQRSPGGLVSALEPVMRRNRGAWIGWTGDIAEVPEPFEVDGLQLVAVEMDTADVEDFYEGFSNATLWPLYHDVIVNPQFHRSWWEAYVRVNRRFANAACAQASRDAVVWVQDYQLQLVPQMVRNAGPTCGSASSTTSLPAVRDLRAAALAAPGARGPARRRPARLPASRGCQQLPPRLPTQRAGHAPRPGPVQEHGVPPSPEPPPARCGRRPSRSRWTPSCSTRWPPAPTSRSAPADPP
jgi:hypothetical protein